MMFPTPDAPKAAPKQASRPGAGARAWREQANATRCEARWLLIYAGDRLTLEERAMLVAVLGIHGRITASGMGRVLALYRRVRAADGCAA
jgi:hypothetical protein